MNLEPPTSLECQDLDSVESYLGFDFLTSEKIIHGKDRNEPCAR